MSNVAKTPRTRPSRTPIGQRGRLTVKDRDPNYAYRWVTSVKSGVTGDRVEMFQEAGWEVVKNSETKTGDGRVGQDSSLGSVIDRSVGVNDRAVLMRIPKDWYEEDQAAKQKRVDDSEQSIKDKVRNTHGGKFERDTNL